MVINSQYLDKKSHFQAIIEQKVPAAIILDANFSDGDGLRFIREYRIKHDIAIPSVVVTDRHNLEENLQAIRGGAIAYLESPVNVPHLIDILHDHLAEGDREPFRIMIVEDSESLADYYAMILDFAGMKTKAVIDPLNNHRVT